MFGLVEKIVHEEVDSRLLVVNGERNGGNGVSDLEIIGMREIDASHVEDRRGNVEDNGGRKRRVFGKFIGGDEGFDGINHLRKLNRSHLFGTQKFMCAPIVLLTGLGAIEGGITTGVTTTADFRISSATNVAEDGIEGRFEKAKSVSFKLPEMGGFGEVKDDEFNNLFEMIRMSNRGLITEGDFRVDVVDKKLKSFFPTKRLRRVVDTEIEEPRRDRQGSHGGGVL